MFPIRTSCLPPTVTGVPSAEPHRQLMRLPDGEIRFYGCCLEPAGPGSQPAMAVQRSLDGGWNWQEDELTEGLHPGATVRSPQSGDWLAILQSNSTMCFKVEQPAVRGLDQPGLYLFRSRTGPDGPFTATRIGEHPLHVQRQILPLRHRPRLLLPFEFRVNHEVFPGILYSDDDGETWVEKRLKNPPVHDIAWPHEGYRWRQAGNEPTVAELGDGRLMMLLRTSVDCHYQCFSEDGGETWTDPEPSPFFSTITMPLLFALRDGRLLAVWNNTTPLPELDHGLQPELNEIERQGVYEDVFTNRDALHAAISEDDGRTWLGFRELHLNERRNDGDFRSSGGNREVLDKSVHQSEALELADGRILLGFGQHARCRKFLLFDVAWLYEKERRDDFSLGLDGWSVQQYLKSIAGNFRGITGHCAYNRRPGATLVPHPDGEPREVLQIARHADVRLRHEKQGAVWNFPACRRGRLTVRLRLPRGSQGLQLALADRWFNPVDPVVAHFAQFVLRIDRAGRLERGPAIAMDQWADLEIVWDADSGQAGFAVAGTEPRGVLPLVRPTATGVSYLHMQSLAETTDPCGALIGWVAQRGE